MSGTGRYVQFLTHDGSWLRGEVVGDRHLGGHDPLSADEQQRLSDIGWNPPGDHGDDCGNFWVDWGEEPGDLGAGAGPMTAPRCPTATSTRRPGSPQRRCARCSARCEVDGVDVVAGHASHADD